MDMGGGKMTWTQGQSLTPPVCLCVCARVCVCVYNISVCVCGFFRISTFASGSLRFSGKLLPPQKEYRPVHVCLFFWGGVCDLLCGLGF